MENDPGSYNIHLAARADFGDNALRGVGCCVGLDAQRHLSRSGPTARILSRSGPAPRILSVASLPLLLLLLLLNMLVSLPATGGGGGGPSPPSSLALPPLNMVALEPRLHVWQPLGTLWGLS